MYKEKVKFRKYNGEITKMLKQKFPKANDFDFADKCAIALSQGFDPTNVYLDNKGMLRAKSYNVLNRMEYEAKEQSILL